MNDHYRELRQLIDEYEELTQEQEAMSDAWENGSPEDMAENDPGLQFEKDEEVAAASDAIMQMCKEIVGR